jgi:hypothetical protein
MKQDYQPAFRIAAQLNKSTFAVIAAAFVLLAVATATARAEIKNFTFRGTISEVEGEGVFDGSITNGAAFEGFYVFDSTAADTDPEPTVGDYQFTNSAFGVVVKIGNYVFRTNPQHVDFLIETVNRPEDDSYLFRSYNNVCSQPVFIDHIAWQLDDYTGAALTNDFLPLFPPNLAAWQNEFGLSISGGYDTFFLIGTVNSVNEVPAVIPERPTVSLSEAVEVRWPSRLGYFYQIQFSEDMQTWTDVGDPILGDGTDLSRFFTRQVGKTFYRIEIANFQK